MASVFTNRGAARALEMAFRGQYNGGSLPTNFYLFLATSAAAPGADTDTKSELTEIAAGNDYTAGGVAKARGTTDVEAVVIDDTNDWSYVQFTDAAWTANGGPIPASGDGARYLVATDDNATAASREVLGSWDLTSDRTVSDGQTLTIQNPELRLAQS